MDDLMDRIQAVLNDKESMQQIQKLAEMFGGSSDSSESPGMSPPNNYQNNVPVNNYNNSQQSNNMDLSKLLGSILGGGNNAQPPPTYGQQPQYAPPPPLPNNQSGDNGLDISKLMALKDIFASANQRDPTTDLLMALRPMLKTETQIKVDKLIKIFKIIAIWPAIKNSGLLGGDLFDFLH